MRLRIIQARPVSLNDTIRHAVELEAFYRAERAKSDGHVSAVATDGNKPIKHMVELQKMVDMLNKRLSQFMGTAETSQPRYGSRKRNCPDIGRGSRDEEKTTSGKPSVFDANVTLRERLSLKPLQVTDATVFDRMCFHRPMQNVAVPRHNRLRSWGWWSKDLSEV
ncbi:hypothetical protein DPMN_150605 [Dreissena polymorpha]|uniref:Uncharacterized protein n=1 Tax=Dreissena polymorpha TaxID=45954 RepID=A0A9D4J5S1_DREPO|nr:hypothetical protein DPMN_150605 [Dreissena polymorpha]